MSNPIEASSVRIMTSKDEVVGTGFLVTEDTVLTCAHVVAAALGIDADTPTKPDAPISLDFPLVDPGHQLTAHAIFWEPIQTNGGGDIAVLQLDSAAPDGTTLARLVFADELWEHDFRAFGFPGKYNGVWASGKLLAREATGWVQIQDIKETGYRVQQGFSGGAVWDEQLDGIAGMVVAEDRSSDLRTAYIIPTHVLIKAWPALVQQAIPACPYRGLFAFREQDAPYFFGREASTRQLVDAVRKKPLLAVVGSSGSGKSSVVFAGLVPRLRREGNWLIVSFRPGNRPLRSLAAALMPLLEPHMSETDRLAEIGKLAQQLQQGNIALQDVHERIKERNAATHLLLIADQFEELYTLCRETEVRQRFLDELLASVGAQLIASSVPDALSFNLVLTLRADFMGQALDYRPFADALQHAAYMLGPMNRTELSDAIRKPAQQLKVKIGDDLTERILNEVSQESGHLPLLEFALTLLWARQRDDKLTHAAYAEIGGVEKALADHAEEVYTGLNEVEQVRAQRVFVQLVRPGEGTEDTRRLATRADIGEDNWDLVTRLSSARLVVSGRDETTGEETVEVVHEALIRGWQRLRDWIEASRKFRTWQERSRAALHEWERSGRDSGALLRGALLVEATTWLAQQPEAISVQERAFIETSQQHQVEEEQYLRKLLEETEQQRQEAERQRERAEQQRLLAEHRQQEADQQRLLAERHRQEAEEQRQIAVTRGLAAQAELLRNQWGELLERRVLLAVEAMQHFPCLEADRALRDGMDLLRRRLASLAHERGVTAVAFSPDGRLLATASEDKTAGVWEVASGRRLASLAHQGSVTAVAFSPDGRLLATASADTTAGVWEVATGRRLASLAHESYVTAVAFSPDGRLLATASRDRTAGVWEVTSGRRLASLAHENSVDAVAFSPDGRLLATASDDKTAGLWEVASGRRLASFAHEDYVKDVAFSADGRLLATASWDKTAGVWEVASGRRLASLAHEGSVYAVAFSADGRLLATASNDTTAGVWEVASGRRLASLAHEGSVYAVAFSADGRLLATASSDKTAGLWEVASGRRLASLAHEANVYAVAFSPDGRLLATASSDKTAGLWEVAGGRRLASLAHENGVRAVAFSPDGRLLATASYDNTAAVWEVASGRRLASLAHENGVRAVAFSPDGRLLATASRDKTAGLWEVASGRRLASLAHESYVNAVAFSPDGRLLATTSADQTAGVWEVASGRRLASLAHEDYVYAVAFSPDGRLLATASADQTAGVWEVASGRRLASLAHEDYVYAVAFSPDGRLLATASRDKTAGLWEVASGRRLASLAHEDYVSAVAFSADGRLLTTASDDKTAGVWEVASGRRLASLAHEGSVYGVAFSPDGRLLATASYDKTAGLWLLQPEDLIAEARSRLNRNLTPSEWKQYMGNEPYRKTFPDLP